MARTTISLPVPLSPVISTVPSVGATRLISAKTRSMARLSPMIPSKPRWTSSSRRRSGVFADQRRALPDLAQDHLQLLGREGLAEVVGGALLHGLDGRFHGGMAGDDDHLGGDAGRLDLAEDLQAVDARHHQVQEDHVEVAGERRLQAGLGVFAAVRLRARRRRGSACRSGRSRGHRRSTGCVVARG